MGGDDGNNFMSVVLVALLSILHRDAQCGAKQSRVSKSIFLMLACACVVAQEDAHSVVLEMEGAPKTGFFGVFDGHGGKEVARFTALYLVRSPSLYTDLCS